MKTRKQIANFVRKVNYGVDIPVSYFRNKRSYSPLAYVVRGKKCRIFINEHHFFRETVITRRSTLLHEVGHLHTYDYSNRDSEGEVYAQIWAYDRAKDLGMTRVAAHTLKIIEDWETDTKELTPKYWTTYLRRYVLASRLYKSGAKKYGKRYKFRRKN